MAAGDGRGASTREAPTAIGGVSALVDDYDGFVLDVWGVLHDGRSLYPGVVETLDRLCGVGKSCVMLSNAPRRARDVAASLARLGLPRRHAAEIVSSGEATWGALRARADPWHAALGQRCYVIGPAHGRSLLDGLDLLPSPSLADADFILNIGPFDSEARPKDYAELLAAGAARGLPMICANPDRQVMQGARRMICAGLLAADYESLGGEVRYHGKPHTAVYDLCLSRLPALPRSRVIAIGDSLETDIAGAAAAGLSSVLVLNGLHADELGDARSGGVDADALARLSARVGAQPDFVTPDFAW